MVYGKKGDVENPLPLVPQKKIRSFLLEYRHWSERARECRSRGKKMETDKQHLLAVDCRRAEVGGW